MSRLLTPTRVEVGLWFALCAGLAAGIGHETDWGRQLARPVTPPAAVSADFTKPTLAPPFRLPPADAYLETALRPIFVVTRRPAPAAPPPDAPKATMKKDQFVLTGTTILPDGKFAFLLEKASKKVHVVAEGKEVNGIRVKEIGADRVTLTQNEDSETLTLKPAKAPPQAGAPMVPEATSAGPATRMPVTRRPPPVPANGVGLPPAPAPGAQP